MMNADAPYVAPKKKQEKMGLGEFLTDQCTFPPPLFHVPPFVGIPLAMLHAWLTLSLTQPSDHGPTKWTRSRCRRRARATEEIVTGVSGGATRSPRGRRHGQAAVSEEA